MAKLRVKAREGQSRCPYCLDELEGEVFACECGAQYHEACTQELRSCAVLGCERSLRRPRAAAPRRRGVVGGVRGVAPQRTTERSDLLKRVAFVVAILIAVFVANLAGTSRTAPEPATRYPQPVHRQGRIPGHLIQHRDRIVEGLRGLVRMQQRIAQLRAEGEAQAAGELLLQYRAQFDRLIADCDYGGPLAGGPQAFQRHVRQEVPQERTLPPQLTQKVLQDFFSQPCW